MAHEYCIVIFAQVRDDLKAIGCSAMLDKYDSYTVKVNIFIILILLDNTQTIAEIIFYILILTGIFGEGGQPESWCSQNDRGHSE